MRKTLTTLMLTMLAALSMTAAVFLYNDGSLARFTGWYHFRPGMNLFPEENLKLLENVSWMRIRDLHDTIECCKEKDGTWWIVAPFRDRLSPVAVQLILSFTAQAELVDTLPLNHTVRASLREFGVESSPHSITLKVPTGDGDMSTVARYTLGSASPWLVDAKDGKNVLPTTYLRTDFYGRDKRIHVVRGNILSIFRNGLEGLRDPNVVNFEPDDLLSLTITRKGQKDITITRQTAESPWTILKPILSAADPDRVDELISLISRLKAARIDAPEAVQLPPAPETVFTLRPANREPLQISVYPAFCSPSDGQMLCYATVNDRPVVFTLPVEPRLRRKNTYSELVNGILSLPVLPPSVLTRLHSANDTVYFSDLSLDLQSLRSSRLSNIDSRDIDKIFIRSRFSPYPLKLLRIPGDTEGQVSEMWMFSAQGKRFVEADREIVAEFLNSLSKVPVTGFERDFEPGEDTTAELKRYGLNNPDYMLILQPKECEIRAVLFGVDMPLVKDRSPRTFYLKRYRNPNSGSYWVAMEQNMLTIYRLSPKMTRLFALTPEAWKKRNMIHFPISSLRTLTFFYQQAQLKLHYDYLGNTWTGTLNDEDITPRINPHRTNYFVRYLQSMRVERWLPEDDEAAQEALKSPVFSISMYLEENDYSDIESITINQQSEVDKLDIDQISNQDNALTKQMLNDDNETNLKFLQIADGARKVNKRTITLDIAPISWRSQKPQFYGRLRETGELFILSYDNAQGLDGNLLD